MSRTEEFEGGVRVVFAVVERPLLREVSFEGNSELTNDELLTTTRTVRLSRAPHSRL